MLIPQDVATPLVGWSPAHAALVGVGLVAVSVPLAVREARHHAQPWLAKLLLISLFLHFAGCVAQAEIVAHLYGNSADFQRYDGQGAALAEGIRHLHLSTAGLTIPGTGAVSVVTGVVYALTGVDQLGGFFVFSWLSLIGLALFYRAARTALPDLLGPRYAGILFLLPSFLYWPSQSGKEALMLLALGLAAIGAAVLLNGQLRGIYPFAAGLTGGAFVRPHEVALVAVSFVVAALVRQPNRAKVGARARWLLTVGFSLGALIVVAVITAHFLKLDSVTGSSVSDAIKNANGHTQKTGNGFGSSHGGWSSSPLAYPRDVATVLLEPLPWHVHSVTQFIALLENTFIVGLAIRYWRPLVGIPRRLRHGGFPMLAALYSVLFIYVFAALGNIGLLDRERTLLLPFLLLPLCVPAHSPAHHERRTKLAEPAEWDVPGVLVRR